MIAIPAISLGHRAAAKSSKTHQRVTHVKNPPSWHTCFLVRQNVEHGAGHLVRFSAVRILAYQMAGPAIHRYELTNTGSIAISLTRQDKP